MHLLYLTTMCAQAILTFKPMCLEALFFNNNNNNSDDTVIGM